jgi:hypothetical protein
MSLMQWNELLAEINVIHQTTFALEERYATGEQGAWAIVDQADVRGVHFRTPGTGERAFTRLEQAITVTDHLLSVGYPAPRYLFIGQAQDGIYSIQLALPGSPIPVSSTAAYVSRLLELNDMQVGQAIPVLPDWHEEAVHTVLFGGEGYCLHSSLQQYAPATAGLLSDLQRLVAIHRDAPHRMHDIVHGDFQHANILAHNDQISGVVDWDHAYAGDSVFDIATLLFYSYDDRGVREQLWRYALERADINLLSVYFAHLMLRQVDWSLRHHEPPTIERYLQRSMALLVDIRHRSRSTRSQFSHGKRSG